MKSRYLPRYLGINCARDLDAAARSSRLHPNSRSDNHCPSRKHLDGLNPAVEDSKILELSQICERGFLLQPPDQPSLEVYRKLPSASLLVTGALSEIP